MFDPVFFVAQENDARSEFARPKVAPDSDRESQEAWIRSMTAKFGSRERGSQALTAEGWLQFRNGKVAVALETFNRARLLSGKNHEAYWGLGAVLSEQGRWIEAIEQLETARELIDNHKQIVSLLADIGAVRTAYAAALSPERELERAQQFSAANQRFAESLEIDPEYAPSWREWAISLYKQERYSEAWIKTARARELKAEPFPADFLRKLKSKMAESN